MKKRLTIVKQMVFAILLTLLISVGAVSGEFYGLWSNQNGFVQVAEAATVAAPRISAIKNVSNGIQLTWSAVSGASYVVYRRTSTGSSWSQIATVASGKYTYVDTKATSNGVTYYYAVRAKKSSTLSAYSKQAKMLRMIAPKPTLKANSNGTITVSWGKVSNATRYNVYRKVDSGGYKLVKAVGSTVTSYTDTSISPNHTYTYYLTIYGNNGIAYNGSNTAISVSSLSTNGTSVGISYLKAVTITATPNKNNGTIALKWNGMPGASKYVVYRTIAGKKVTIATVTSPAFTDKNVHKLVSANNTTVTYQVVPANTKHTGASASKSTTMDKYLNVGASTITAATFNVADGSVTVKWNAVTNATQYTLYRTVSGTKVKIGTTTGLSWVNKDAYKSVPTDKTTVTYTVVASNPGKTGTAGTKNVVVNKNLTTANSTITSLSQNESANVIIKWSAATNATKYTLYRTINGTKKQLTSGTGLSFTDTEAKSLVAGTGSKVTYTIVAGNSIGSATGTSKDIVVYRPIDRLTLRNSTFTKAKTINASLYYIPDKVWKFMHSSLVNGTIYASGSNSYSTGLESDLRALGFTSESNINGVTEPSITKVFDLPTKSTYKMLLANETDVRTSAHEFGHAVDMALSLWNKGTRISSSSEWVALHNAEKKVNGKNLLAIYKAIKYSSPEFYRDYAMNIKSEYFAECFMLYFANPSTLKQYLPKEYNLIAKWIGYINNNQLVGEVTAKEFSHNRSDDSVSLSWNAAPNATSYNIYIVPDKTPIKIATVSGTSYKQTDVRKYISSSGTHVVTYIIEPANNISTGPVFKHSCVVY